MLGIEPKVWAVEAWCGDLGNRGQVEVLDLAFGCIKSETTSWAQPTWFKQLKQFQTFISETF